MMTDGRVVRELDVQDLLCGPDPNTLPNNAGQRPRISAVAMRQSHAFVTLVEAIIRKEDDDRTSERARRAP
jgi:hypothetical protein